MTIENFEFIFEHLEHYKLLQKKLLAQNFFMNFLKMICLCFLILNILSSHVVTFKIKDVFSYCKDKEEFFDISQSCNRANNNLLQRLEYLECEMKTQVLKMRSMNEDSYFKLDGSVFHVVNGSIKYTFCYEINEIEVHEEVDKCTKDILVSFYFENKLTFGFLTNENIIRPKNKLIECPIEAKFLSGKEINIIKKGNKIMPVRIKRVLSVLKNVSENWILSYYEKNMELNREFRLGCDILLSVVALINLIYFSNKKMFHANRFETYFE
jgi:hypothetical protein